MDRLAQQHTVDIAIEDDTKQQTWVEYSLKCNMLQGVRVEEKDVGVRGDNKVRLSVCAHLSCWTVAGSFSLNTELCVCMSEA